MKHTGRMHALLLAGAVGFVCMPRILCAAGFTLSPAVIDIDIEPRDIIAQTIVIENTSGAPMTLFPSVNNVTTGVDGGMQQFVPPSMSDRTSSLASWLEISRAAVELRPGEKKEISLTVRVAPGAKPGDYHAMIAYASGTTVDEAMPQIAARAVPIVFINATLAAHTKEWVNLSGFSVKKFVTSFREGDAQYRVENTGDTELVPIGDIVIYNQRGEEVASVPVNPTKQSVKPGDTAVFTAGIPIEHMLGKYKAFLTLKYGSTQAAVYDTVYFYAMPWKKMLLAFATFVSFSLVCALYVHRRYTRGRRADEEYDAEYPDDAHDPNAVAIVPLRAHDTVSRPHHRDVVMKK